MTGLTRLVAILFIAMLLIGCKPEESQGDKGFSSRYERCTALVDAEFKAKYGNDLTKPVSPPDLEEFIKKRVACAD